MRISWGEAILHRLHHVQRVEDISEPEGAIERLKIHDMEDMIIKKDQIIYN